MVTTCGRGPGNFVVDTAACWVHGDGSETIFFIDDEVGNLLKTGDGNDLIIVRDDAFDNVIDCGGGDDLVLVFGSPADNVFASCENVIEI